MLCSNLAYLTRKSHFDYLNYRFLNYPHYT